VAFRIAGEPVTVSAGEIVTMETGTPHELSGLEESTVLLTIGGGGKARRKT
jgi:quercetin dioxygenase-like cupin family protein